nr:helix-turn-helix transcriptional regulator [Tenuibacillus multivorans]
MRLKRPEVAQILGITPQFLGAIERGERNPSLNLAKNIADFYNSSIDELFF